MAVSSLSDLECAALLFRGLGHPLRLRILLALESETLSPSDLGQRLRVALGLVAYHVRTLRDDGLLELVDTRVARGSLQSFYRLSDRGRRARRLLEAACGELRDGAERR